MLKRILKKSISRRKSRIAIAVIAVMIGASIAGALLTVSLNIRDKVGNEFRQYGANILLVPKTSSVSVTIGDVDYGSVTEQKYIAESDLSKIDEIYWSKNILGYAPYLYSIVETEGHKVVLTGVWFDQVQLISPWWDLEGKWIEDRSDTENAIIGTTVSKVLGLGIGDAFTIRYNDTRNESVHTLTVAGVVSTGSSEDDQIFVNLDLAQAITNRMDKVSTVQVSALCTTCPVDVIAGEIEGNITYVEAKSVKQMVSAEMSILSKIESMMLLVTGVALLASALGVMTTMTASVIERTKEIGLMKAIGADNRRIATLFLSEALLIGLVGGLLGYLVGIGVAQFIGMSVFGSTMTPVLTIVPVVVGLSIGVALLASALPVRTALNVEPARVLRGD